MALEHIAVDCPECGCYHDWSFTLREGRRVCPSCAGTRSRGGQPFEPPPTKEPSRITDQDIARATAVIQAGLVWPPPKGKSRRKVAAEHGLTPADLEVAAFRLKQHDTPNHEEVTQ